MGVDFYPCKSCGEVFCDCGEYVCCIECGSKWCSDDCASDDGYEKECCKLGKDVEEQYCNEKCEFTDEEGSCSKCNNYVYEGCNYCRHEDYEDSELLKYALEALDMSRNDLIEAINLQKQELAKKGNV